MANFTERNQNSVPALIAKSNAGDNADVIVWADPATHRLLVNASVTVGAVSGSKSNNNAAPGSDNIGAFVGVATAAAPSYTEGNLVGLSTDLAGNLRVTGSLSVGGTTDNSAFTAGSSTGTPTMGFFHSVIDTVTDGRAAAVAITSKRAMMVNLQTSSGSETGIAALPLQVSLANTGANATAIKVDGSAVTQPVSSAAASTHVDIGLINAVTPLMGNGVTGTGSLRVTIASDNTAFSVNATLSAETTKVIGTVRNLGNGGAIFDGVNTAATAPANGILGLGIFNSTEPSPTTGQSVGIQLDSKGRQRMVIMDAAGNTRGQNVNANSAALVAFDQTTLGTTNGVSLAAVNAAAALAGNGVTGTGSLRVTIASDNSAVALWGHAATAGSVPANAVYQGKRGTTALPTAVTDGQVAGAMSDKFGRAVTLIGTIRDLTGTQTTTISASTSETTIVTAGGAGVFNDLVMLIISNTSASTNTRIDFRDTTAGSILFSLQSNGGQPPVGFSLPVPIPQTSANTNWTAQCATSTTDVRIYAVFAKNK